MKWPRRRRIKRGPNPNSRIRQRAAAILSSELGWDVAPEDIEPVQGFYRSCWLADVYRWEVFTRDNNGMTCVAGCWETLTEFVKEAAKHGCHVDADVITIGRERCDVAAFGTWNEGNDGDP